MGGRLDGSSFTRAEGAVQEDLQNVLESTVSPDPYKGATLTAPKGAQKAEASEGGTACQPHEDA